MSKIYRYQLHHNDEDNKTKITITSMEITKETAKTISYHIADRNLYKRISKDSLGKLRGLDVMMSLNSDDLDVFKELINDKYEGKRKSLVKELENTKHILTNIDFKDYEIVNSER